MVILHRHVEKPRSTPSDRLWLILKPETLSRWHRQGFRTFWTFKSRDRGGRPWLATETIRLIQRMASENRLRGAERVHGELFKLDIQVAMATIREYIRRVRPPRPPSQTWSVFLENHAKEVWACDFLHNAGSGWMKELETAVISNQPRWAQNNETRRVFLGLG